MTLRLCNFLNMEENRNLLLTADCNTFFIKFDQTRIIPSFTFENPYARLPGSS
jgi:hypothetical protein